MNSQCKPTVNRIWKMVPEGGFEPPTRGFSILLQPLKYNADFVNCFKNSLNGIKGLRTACKPKSKPLVAAMGRV